MSQELKLKIELVPRGEWYKNLRKQVKQSVWDKIRKKAYADAGHKCSICGTKGRLNCHEIWDYNDDTQVQTLMGFTAVCNMCHHVHHLGLARILARQGKINFDDVVNHFLSVNECDREMYDKHEAQAFALWQERSQHSWKQEYGEYTHLLDQ